MSSSLVTVAGYRACSWEVLRITLSSHSSADYLPARQTPVNRGEAHSKALLDLPPMLNDIGVVSSNRALPMVADSNQ